MTIGKTGFAAIVGAAFLAVGLSLSGAFIKSGLDNLAFRDRQVTVKGLAEREVEANTATWSIQYSVAGNDLISLYDQVTANNDKIITFMTRNGIPREDITVNPPDTYNAATNQYSSGNFKYAYSLNCQVNVSTGKVAKVRELLDRQSELLKEGIATSNSYVNYDYTLLNTIKPAMIAEATKNAREAAAQFASDSGSEIGKMKTATQGQFSIDDVSSAPWMKKVRVVTTIVYYLDD